jgi:hypothetical protein
MNEFFLKFKFTPAVMVTDCANNMVCASRSLPCTWSGCLAHRLEKVARAFFDDTDNKEVLDKARKLAGHYHHSSQAKAELLSASKIVMRRPKGLTTIQDTPTRWWSTFSLVDRLLVLRKSLETLIGVEDGIYYPPALRLDNTEWTILQISKNVLEPIRDAQESLEGEYYPTSSLIVPYLADIRLAFNDANAAANGHPEEQRILEAMESIQEAFVQRFGNGRNIVPKNTPSGNAVTGSMFF